MKTSQHMELVLNSLEKALKKPAMDDCEIDERDEEIKRCVNLLKVIAKNIKRQENKIDSLPTPYRDMIMDFNSSGYNREIYYGKMVLNSE